VRRRRKSLEQMVDGHSAKWGRVDVLVNNAGIVMDAQLKNMSEDQFDTVKRSISKAFTTAPRPS